MEIRKIEGLTERVGLKKGQKVKLLRDFYDSADFDEDRRPVHRKGDVGVIDGFGQIYDHEVVAVEICHHGRGTFEVAPFRPSDIETAPPETSITQPDQPKEDSDDSLPGPHPERPVILLDIKKLD